MAHLNIFRIGFRLLSLLQNEDPLAFTLDPITRTLVGHITASLPDGLEGYLDSEAARELLERDLDSFGCIVYRYLLQTVSLSNDSTMDQNLAESAAYLNRLLCTSHPFYRILDVSSKALVMRISSSQKVKLGRFELPACSEDVFIARLVDFGNLVYSELMKSELSQFGITRNFIQALTVQDVMPPKITSKPSLSPNYISPLPTELHDHILDYLDDVNDILNLRFMSRYFSDIGAGHMFKHGFTMRPHRPDMDRFFSCFRTSFDLQRNQVSRNLRW